MSSSCPSNGEAGAVMIEARAVRDRFLKAVSGELEYAGTVVVTVVVVVLRRAIRSAKPVFKVFQFNHSRLT